MEALMKRATTWSGIGLLMLTILYLIFPQKILLSLVLTFLVTFYQLGMRLVVGNVIEPRLKLDQDCRWFRVTAGEQRLYRLLKVRKWKSFLPTYSPEKYDLRRRSLPQLIQTMIAAEFDHELMFILTYLPLILIVPFGDPAIFISTSVIVSLIELPFIILQRYNRARLQRLLRRRERRQRMK
ncbi:hypothetical protein [Limosilactobacillus sp.]|jgi:hypothetical protein|uniref:glycosyl-4,4'-diaponeurosporenoate acyltransferase CrtO family protein n=1 Tax=Limosilactobacillus sp. TaxID=2773925 RepID=UPI0025BC15CE|nr:hypothetical protein [Limosilactobacillus sp.]MCH3922196.1 hypothetical protein [Limosilactobacillus sp.]MCH3928967.1 hypothetical protein [Limosilactobacillus sp.]